MSNIAMPAAKKTSTKKRPKAAPAKKPAGRVYGGISLEQRRAQRRQTFLDAGLTVFGRDGFRAATVRGLCREAGLTDRYFYENFENLEALLMAVYRQQMDRIRDNMVNALQQAPQSASTVDKVRSMLEAYFQMLENPHVARVCMVELEGVSTEVEQLYHGVILAYSQLLIELAQGEFPDHSIDADEAHILSIALVGAMRQTGTHWFLSQYALPRDKMVDASCRLAMGVLKELALPIA